MLLMGWSMLVLVFKRPHIPNEDIGAFRKSINSSQVALTSVTLLAGKA